MSNRVSSREIDAVIFATALERGRPGQSVKVVVDATEVEARNGEYSSNYISVEKSHRHGGDPERDIPTYVVTIGRAPELTAFRNAAARKP